MIIKTRPNNKIIFHWILIIISTGLLFYNADNKMVIFFVVVYFILQLIFNRVIYLKLQENHLNIIQANFLFITTSKLSINIYDINSISIVDYRRVNTFETVDYMEFEAVVIIELITGSFFYRPNSKFLINLKQNKRIEFKINSKIEDNMEIILVLQKQIGNKLMLN